MATCTIVMVIYLSFCWLYNLEMTVRVISLKDPTNSQPACENMWLHEPGFSCTKCSFIEAVLSPQHGLMSIYHIDLHHRSE